MKTVLITGASRGIGRATAIKFAKEGWQVAVNYVKNIESAKAVCDEINGFDGCAKMFCADVSKAEEVEKMISEVEKSFGGIDVLVNNAGIALPQGLFTDFSDAEWRRLFDINVFGMMNCSKAVIPKMVSRKSGRIINLSSIWGISGGSCEVIYSASKAAVIGFTKALAAELAPSGICVNCVAPGFIDTDMNSHISEADRLAFAEEIPLGRIGKAEEVAEAVFFLSGDNAAYINGHTLTVDGGIVG